MTHHVVYLLAGSAWTHHHCQHAAELLGAVLETLVLAGIGPREAEFWELDASRPFRRFPFAVQDWTDYDAVDADCGRIWAEMERADTSVALPEREEDFLAVV